ncbi:hypothetical protein OCUBac02_48820 (plasmid) [Bosea sp. ANAM02]|nr:hypothetical protein OCUBac02_48820 [Bosea sp. ANAM02]
MTFSEAEIIAAAGLNPDADPHIDPMRSETAQRRLRNLVEILNKVKARFGSATLAFAWYRSEAMLGLSGKTAMKLVREGRAGEAIASVDAVDAGFHN